VETMGECVEGVGGPGPGQREELRLADKLDRALLTNTDGDADSGVDETETAQPEPESRERREEAGARQRAATSRIPRKTPPDSPLKKAPRARSSAPTEKRRMPRSKSVPKSNFAFSLAPPPEPVVKKVPMNKIVVGSAPSPNLMSAQSRIGSLANTQHRPGGGNVKIENRKLEWSAQARTKMVNENYTPGGGDKKIENRKLNWNAQSKIKSLDNHTHKPGGGDKKIENRKLEWNVDSRVGSTKNLRHQAGGGNVRIHNEKLEFKVQSRIGSLANVKHRPGGGDKKIFDDKEYARQMSEQGSVSRSGPGSLTGSVVGSHNQLAEQGPRSLDYSRVKGKQTHPADTNHFALHVARQLSPQSNGF